MFLYAFLILQFSLFPFLMQKWMWTSLESLLTLEFYLDVKIYLDYFPGRLKQAEVGKSMSYILSSTAKSW